MKESVLQQYLGIDVIGCVLWERFSGGIRLNKCFGKPVTSQFEMFL